MAIQDQTIGQFLHALGDKTPTPGGGAVAGVGAAIASALAQMVLRFAIGKTKFAEHEQTNRAALADLERAMNEALQAAEDDERAYGALNRLWKLPSDHPDRVAHWEPAVKAAIDAPMRMLAAAQDVLDRVMIVTGTTSATLASDLAIAADFAIAAARSAAWNVRINLPLLPNGSDVADLEARLQRDLSKIEATGGRIDGACRAALKPTS